MGRIGLTLMVLFGAYLLLPNFFTQGTMATETYLLFVAWCVLGFLVFRLILKGDKQKRFGKTIVAWVALLLMELMVALIWMNQSMLRASSETRAVIHAHYQQREADEIGAADEEFIDRQIDRLSRTNTQTMIVTAGMFAFALAVMFTNFSYISKKVQESELALSRANNLMNTDPLTGVKSKHAYLNKEKEINDAIKGDGTEDFSVVVCDVNGLKKINDTLGHKAGDEYILAAARMVCEIFDHSPVYRIGGDEFVMILTGRDYEVRGDLMKLLHDRSVDNIGKGRVVVSGGISDYRSGVDASFHDVFSRADQLMYKEKQLLRTMGSISREN
jgi:diguanylate cyclase (GGDEF)-like protein